MIAKNNNCVHAFARLLKRSAGLRWVALLLVWIFWTTLAVQDGLFPLDRAALAAVVRTAGPFADRLAYLAARPFNLRLYLPIVFGIALVLVLGRKRRLVPVLLLAVTSAFLIERGLRAILLHSVPRTPATLELRTRRRAAMQHGMVAGGRPRFAKPGAHHSYPSGHAAQVVVVLLLLAEIRIRVRYLAWLWRAVLFAIAALVVWSQLYFGFHGVSDCLGGLGLGALCVLAWKWLLTMRTSRGFLST